jgi:hypothetical protein
MPRISQFYGIVIYMYHRDHSPPHFHAIYGEYEAEVDIATSLVSQGKLPRRAKRMVTQWATTHRDALQRNWQSAQTGQPLDPIPPLD